MKYTINPIVFGSSFSFPCSAVDKCLKIATETEIKVILYFFRHYADGINPDQCAQALNISNTEVIAALSFWVNNNIVFAENSDKNETPVNNTVIAKNQKPSRSDVAKRGSEDKNFALILNEAQLKLGRSLKSNESSTFLYIYEDLGLDLSVCLYLLQYAVNQGKANIRFIEKTAVNWVNLGVNTISDAEKIVIKELSSNLAWKRCEKAFGIEHRKPSPKELDFSLKWFDEWKLDEEYLLLAYNVCIDTKSKFIFSYCAKIIENWHNMGFVSALDVKNYLAKNSTEKSKPNNYAGYDLELYEKMLDADD